MNVRKLFGRIALILVTVVLLAFIYFRLNSMFINTNFAERITLEYAANGETREGFVTEISQDDIAALKKKFNGVAVKDTPSCPCDGLKLIFKSDDKSLTIYPAGDGCDTVRVEHSGQDYYFHLGDKNNIIVKEILAEYGVIWPYGI